MSFPREHDNQTSYFYPFWFKEFSFSSQEQLNYIILKMKLQDNILDVKYLIVLRGLSPLKW